MKTLFLFVAIGLLLITAVRAGEAPAAELLEYGVYSGSSESLVAVPGSPTDQMMLGGRVRLEKTTDQIPARLKSKFGFRFVVHGQANDTPVRLRLVYLFPEMKDPTSGRRTKTFAVDVVVKREDRNTYMLWDFTEHYELVSGPWTFQVFRGSNKILEKQFDVVPVGLK